MTDFGDELHRLLGERGISLREAARQAGCSPGYLSNVAKGRKPLTPSLAARLDQVLGTGGKFTEYALKPEQEHLPTKAELVRQGLDKALNEGTMAQAGLDDWERTVAGYGRATRDRPAGVILHDLKADLVELRQALERYRSASALRELTRAAAQMCGLMCLTLIKLDNRREFRQWARTARTAASEAGDPATSSWVLAQEAHGHYYSTDFREAVEVARHAQEVVHETACVGAALAAALEARAQAAMGRHRETHTALTQAEEILSHLHGDELAASAFGYTEGQLRFHEGNAYTHLHDTRLAYQAQNRALQLCAPGDYTDWALTRLDRATCLAGTGDAQGALAYATETLTNLTEPQRQGIITLRGHEILNGVPLQQQRTLPAARDFRELLQTTGKEEVTRS